MPEGDTIHKVANFLAPRLEGVTARRVQIPDPAGTACNGRRIDRVFAHGKHLFIEFDNEMLLRSHLGMHGSWHRYREDEAWQKPRRQASLVLAADDWLYICFNAKEVELIRSPSVRERILGTRLGPDLVHESTDVGEVVSRAREFLAADDPLVDVLLDQRVAAGIGNVYKSEVMFIERLHPTATLGALGDDTLAGCFDLAGRLLRRNLGGGKRVTRFEGDRAGRLWVYRRKDLPCLRCDDRITYARIGKDHRSTYWCERCQG